jgi:hypothetical protein
MDLDLEFFNEIGVGDGEGLGDTRGLVGVG